MAESKDNECVAVVVRCRPLNRKEKDESRSHIIDISVADRQVSIRNPDDANDTKSFTYDGAYDENTVQRNFYEESCFGIVESVLEGFNGTIFAYGQTGCGKSFTMQGPSATSPEMRGVIPNSFSHIFECVKAATDVQYLIRCSYLEIYNEEIKDLLGNQKNPNKCDIKEDPAKGVFVKGLTDVVVDTEDQLMAMLEKGISFRTVAATQMNAESSRSHSIFTVVVEMSSVDKDTGKEMLRAGKLNLVDLAGSERQKKTGATGALLKEGAKINLSLSALGNVISSLSEGAKGKHIPYRDSKLTRLLQDSLGGNTKTLMVAAISPADYNYDETMSTLRYANRAKNIKNKPKINEDPKDTMLREFKEEIERLRKMLADQAGLVEMAKGGGLPTAGGAGGGVPVSQGLSPTRRMTVSATDVMVDDDVVEDGGYAPARQARPAAAHDDDGSRVDRRALDELTQAVAEERDYVSEQLRLKESEIEQERRMREELMQRLAALQQHVVGDRDADHLLGAAAAAAAPAAAGSYGGFTAGGTAGSVKMMSEEEQQEARREREEATKRLKERRLRAKKKRDEQQAAEMARVLQVGPYLGLDLGPYLGPYLALI
jgi:kinesin family protein 3/17